MTFAACGNTQANQAKAENKPVTLISEAKVTPSGVVRLMELQKQGYAYIRPLALSRPERSAPPPRATS